MGPGEPVTLLKSRSTAEQEIALGRALQTGNLGLLVESTLARRYRAWICSSDTGSGGSTGSIARALRSWANRGLSQFLGFDEDVVRAGVTPYR
jgi:hypothetical protein